MADDAFETDIYMYLFLENMTGGELFDRIVDMGHFTEAQAQETTFKLLGAIKYMHDKGLAHRDLKPENMLMKAKKDEPNGTICKITDFGLSKFFDEQSVRTRGCSSPRADVAIATTLWRATSQPDPNPMPPRTRHAWTSSCAVRVRLALSATACMRLSSCCAVSDADEDAVRHARVHCARSAADEGLRPEV